MKVKIDEETCTGCGLCVDICPDVFELPEDVAVVKAGEVPPSAEDCATEAAESCPVESIELS